MTPARLLSLRHGYARRACDGALSWPVVEVGTVDELRYAVRTDRTWVRVRGGYQDEGGAWHRLRYVLDRPLVPAPHVVIQGFGWPHIMGHGILARHPHLLLGELIVRHVVGDAIEVTSGGREVCVIATLIERWGDGAFDVVRAPEGDRDDHLNVSLVRSTIRNGAKAMLIGSHPQRHHDRRYRVSIRRTTLRDIGLRAPRIRYATVHMSYCRVDGVAGSTASHLSRGARLILDHVEYRRLAGEAVTYEDDGTAVRSHHVIGAAVPSVRPELVAKPDWGRV